jgi:cell wall-associated NlpC family hydrolase
MRSLLALLLSTALSSAQVSPAAAPAPEPDRATYQSPYVFAAAVTDPALTPDFQQPPKRPQDFQDWSRTPFADWYDLEAIRRLHTTWGPYYRDFTAPDGVLALPASWDELRVLAAANQLRGAIPYGHHHMHVWNVPDAPRWRDAHIPPGIGIDCSDFTHWAYSYGLGILLPTGIEEQAAITHATLHLADGSTRDLPAQRIADIQNGFPHDFQKLAATLQPGDLLFIRSDPALTNKISHVIMWLGQYASDTNHKDTYFVMDSHGDVVVDSNGNKIPSGPQIRPFREKSYYFSSYDHALRFFPLQPASQ